MNIKFSKIIPVIILLLGIFPLVMIYILNADNRIYSSHGFIHAGIVYQILNGNIPPLNPLLGGQPLLYHWGYHYLAALITMIFHITPFYSFAFINLASLSAVIILIYKISGLLIKDKKANILSVLISIFGPTIFIIPYLISIGVLPERFFIIGDLHRSIPAFNKFSNINGVPIGVTFLLLSLYSIVRFFRVQKINLYLLMFLVSFLGCGFFYPAFFLVATVNTFLACFIMLLPNNNERYLQHLRQVIMLIIATIIGFLILSPYLYTISAGLRQYIQFFNLAFTFKKINSCIFVYMPVLIIIYMNKKYLRTKLNRQAMFILLAVIATALFLYVAIHLTGNNEYKFFLIAGVYLGILGGIGFNAMLKWRNNFFILILLFMFLFCVKYDLSHKLRLQNNISKLCIERSMYVYSLNKNENELYQWIRNNTFKNSIFIDSKLAIPIFAQRQLFIGRGGRSKGYSISIDGKLLKEINGYDSAIINKRKNIVDNIYALDQKLSYDRIKDLYGYDEDIYIVARTKKLKNRLKNSKLFDEIFKTSDGDLSIHRLANVR